MNLELDQLEIEQCITDYVRKMGIEQPISKVIFTAGRKGNGVSAAVEIEVVNTVVPLGEDSPLNLIALEEANWPSNEELQESQEKVDYEVIDKEAWLASAVQEIITEDESSANVVDIPTEEKLFSDSEEKEPDPADIVLTPPMFSNQA